MSGGTHPYVRVQGRLVVGDCDGYWEWGCPHCPHLNCELSYYDDLVRECDRCGAESYVVGPPLSERIDWSAALDAYFKEKGM